MNSSNLIKKLPEITKKSSSSNILFGFDGFIDNIYQVIKKRINLNQYIAMEKISEFSERINAASGSSAAMEVIIKRQATGGFVPNTCRGIATLQGQGQNIQMIGCFGLPEIDSLFTSLFSKVFKCKMETVGNPGKTNAYEFTDGKIMISEFTGLQGLNMEAILKNYGSEKLIKDIQNADLFGIGYWSIGPHMTEIFRGLLDIIKGLPPTPKRLKLFFDFADVKKKPVEELLIALNIVHVFSKHAEVTLSVNDKEAEFFAHSFNIEFPKTEDGSTDYELLGKKVFEKLEIDRFVIHTPKRAYGWAVKSGKIQYEMVPQAFTSNAAFTTSAGDMFNSGLCVGLISDLELEDLLLMGNVMSAYFIRTGFAPNLDQFSKFLEKYSHYLKVDTSNIL
jgi:hypothetical protein